MRKPLLLIVINAAMLLVLFVLMAQSLFWETRVASTHRVSGRVDIKRAASETFVPLHSGASVQAGDEVRTHADGRAEFGWSDGTLWKVEPQTRFTIEHGVLNSLRQTQNTLLRLDTGRVWLRVVNPNDAQSSFGVRTPTILATVAQTQWNIEVRGEQTRVGVERGQVELHGAGGEQTVRAGRLAVCDESGIQLRTMSAPQKHLLSGALPLECH